MARKDARNYSLFISRGGRSLALYAAAVSLAALLGWFSLTTPSLPSGPDASDFTQGSRPARRLVNLFKGLPDVVVISVSDQIRVVYIKSAEDREHAIYRRADETGTTVAFKKDAPWLWTWTHNDIVAALGVAAKTSQNRPVLLISGRFFSGSNPLKFNYVTKEGFTDPAHPSRFVMAMAPWVRSENAPDIIRPELAHLDTPENEDFLSAWRGSMPDRAGPSIQR